MKRLVPKGLLVREGEGRFPVGDTGHRSAGVSELNRKSFPLRGRERRTGKQTLWRGATSGVCRERLPPRSAESQGELSRARSPPSGACAGLGTGRVGGLQEAVEQRGPWQAERSVSSGSEREQQALRSESVSQPGGARH